MNNKPVSISFASRIPYCTIWTVLIGTLQAPAVAQSRVLESIIPSLVYSISCSSTVELQNLSDRRIEVDVVGHRSSGALAPLTVHAAINRWMEPGASETFRMRIDDDPGAWVKVTERIPEPGLSPAIAVSGSTECISENQLSTVRRDVAWPVRNPWLAIDAAELPSGLISLIDTSEQPVRAVICYSSGSFYSVPEENHKPGQTRRLCSSSADVQIAPFGSREFPVEQEGTHQFSLKTEGNGIVLEALRPVEAKVKLYAVDSSITFGSATQ
jgi:hypothetical protein